MKKIMLAFVTGNEGPSLQIYQPNGSGYRFAGPKAWGNPYNKASAEFEVDVEAFKKALDEYAYETKKED